MNFNINKISENRFDELINDIDNPSIFQSSKFLRTNLLDQKNKLIYLLVSDELNKNIAIVVVTIKNYFNLFKIYRINRGPLFFDKENLNLSQREGIISKIFLFVSKKQFGLKLFYISPEIRPNSTKDTFLKKHKFKITNKYYGSSLLDISLDEQILFENLLPKWRNLLRKGIELHKESYKILNSSDDIEIFINQYLSFAKTKNFKTKNYQYFQSLLINNPSVFILAKNFNNDLSCPFDGAVVVVINGNTSTYYLGFSNNSGRKSNINYYLLWEAILFSKKSGCLYFDLGGVTINTPNGIKHFKNGLNGVSYTNIRDRFKLNLF